MCLPLAVIGAGVAAAGALVGGVQSMMSANSEAKIARQNSQLSIEQARDSQDRGRDEARAFYRQAGQVKGQQVASMAANGIDVGYGTAVNVRDDTDMLIGEDAKALHSNIDERTRGFQINAMNYTAEASAAKQRGRSAMASSVFEAGGSLMSGFSQQKMMKAKLGTVARPAPQSYIRGSFGG